MTAAPTNLATVSALGVAKAFGSTRALDGVDLTLEPGVCGLLGRNGAGKTTLLRILATVLAPDSGTVRLLGRDPARPDHRVEIRRRLGYLPQEPGFHPNFTAYAFVDYVAILKEMTDRPARRAEVRRVLEAVGLGEVTGKRIRSLSGGMRRRVGLAQALLGNPELLLLDEPTAGLDPEQRLRFRELVTAQPHQTVVLSTHQTEDVAALCSQVVVIDAGAVRFTGSPAELAATATGRVWIGGTRSPGAHLAWRTADGRQRQIGNPPPGAELVAPSVEDGYLLLVGPDPAGAAA